MDILVGTNQRAHTNSNKTDLARSWQQKLQKEVVPQSDALLFTLAAFALTIAVCVCVKPPIVLGGTQYKTTLNYPLIVLLALALAAVVYWVDDGAIDTLVALVA